MIWFFLSLPPLAGALAYGRAPFFAWFVAGLVWLSGLAWVGAWPTGAVLLTLLLYLLVVGSFSLPLAVRLALTLPALGLLAWLCVTKLGRGHVTTWLRETWDLLRKVIPILIPAVLVIGLLAQVVPLSATRWMSGRNSLGANAGAAVFGALMYFPILTEVAFVKALLKVMGAGIGPALAIMLTAPGLSLPGMIIVARDIGWRRVLAYVGCITLLSAATGMLFGSQWGAYICSCLW